MRHKEVFSEPGSASPTVAAAAGAPILLLSDQRAPDTYVPVNDPKRVIRRGALADVTVEEVYAATRQLLVAGRTATLFAS